MKKEETPQAKLSALAAEIKSEVERWERIRLDGCNDPFWADGCNMNLCRNHVIYRKRELKELCQENGMALPGEYWIPTPPEVKNDYMANLNQTRRVERLEGMGHKLTTEKPEGVAEQQIFF